jgi:beta-alanine--pyruvate transaminase
MPFTANRQFKKAPRMLVAAKDMHYTTSDGRQVLDGTAGLWCVNAGHCRPKITEAIQKQAAELDYAPAFQMGHPKAFELANRLRRHRARRLRARLLHQFRLRGGRDRAQDRHRLSPRAGEGARTRLIGRERGYHGVNFGGISVGGIVNNRKMFGTLLTGVDHLPHTHDPANNTSRAASPSMARNSPTSWSASSRCTTPRPSPP